MKAIVLSALLGGIAVFVWGYVFWNVLPSSELAYDLSQNDRKLISFLEQRYELPSTQVNYLAGEETPVVATIFLKRSDGFLSMLWQGLAHMIISVGLIAVLVRIMPNIPTSYVGRLSWVAMLGFVASIVANLSDPVWFTQTWSWHIVQAAYDFTFWVVAGLVVAAIVKPTTIKKSEMPST